MDIGEYYKSKYRVIRVVDLTHAQVFYEDVTNLYNAVCPEAMAIRPEDMTYTTLTLFDDKRKSCYLTYTCFIDTFDPEYTRIEDQNVVAAINILLI